MSETTSALTASAASDARHAPKFGTAARVFAQLLLVISFLGIGGVIVTVFTYVPFVVEDVEGASLDVGSLTMTTFRVSQFAHDYWYLAVGGYLLFFTAATFACWSRAVAARVALALATVCLMVSAFFCISFALGLIEAVQQLARLVV